MKTIVYTANMGGYDTLQRPREIDPAVEYLCFTDDAVYRPPEPWRPIVTGLPDETPRVKAKHIKLRPHIYIPLDCHVSVWIDANVELQAGVDEILRHLGSHDIALFEHPNRDGPYQEIAACRDLGGHRADRLDNAYGVLLQHDVPARSGLWWGGFLVRRNNYRVHSFCRHWWALCRDVTWRDQLTFPILIHTPFLSLNLELDGTRITTLPRDLQKQWVRRGNHTAVP